LKEDHSPIIPPSFLQIWTRIFEVRVCI